MKFLLDTNAVIALLKGHPPFAARLRQHHPQDFGISAIVAHELYYGAFRSRHTAENLARIEDLPLEVSDFDREDARQAGELRAALAAAGTPIGPYDVLIAG
jgi:tRNA(fMet)-specific endonuclease VapC